MKCTTCVISAPGHELRDGLCLDCIANELIKERQKRESLQQDVYDLRHHLQMAREREKAVTSLAVQLKEALEEMPELFNAAAEKQDECTCGNLSVEFGCPYCAAWSKAEQSGKAALDAARKGGL